MCGIGNNVLCVMQFQPTPVQETFGQPEPLLAKYVNYRNTISMTRQIFGKCALAKGVRGGVVVKAVRYKPAGRGFDSRWCHWNFSVT